MKKAIIITAIMLTLPMGVMARGNHRSSHYRFRSTPVTQPAPTPTPDPVPAPSSGPVLVTNEYAYWNPTDPKAIKSDTWEMTSGSLFMVDGQYWTGKVDDVDPNYDSSNGTDSAIFRLNTKQSYTNFTVSFNLYPLGFTSTKSTPSVAWDGVHVFLRHESQYNLYYASVLRRDGNVVIKKKCEGGPDNGGTYYELASKKASTPTNIRVSIQDQSDGSAKISIYNGSTVVLSAVDKGVGCAVIKSGATGIRGDNLEFKFDNFNVD